MRWMLLPLRRYAEFSGRSRRKEFWLFIVGVVAMFTILTMLAIMFSGGADRLDSNRTFKMVLGFAFLALLVPLVAVQVRRLHDQDKPGWLVLLNFIPYLGTLIMLVLMCLRGTVGPNKYGPDPRDGDARAA